MDTWYDEKYKYYHCASYCDLFELPNSNWSNHTFVSLDSKGQILGCIGYSIVRDSNSVDGIGAINFSENKVEFGKDLIQVIKNIFEKFNYRKLSFSVIVGNPIERSYDRMTLKYGGRIVGTNKEHVKLMDGKYYDQKFYEIMREDYIHNVDKSNIL